MVPCNDEYWDPAPWNSVFCQPSDTPSLVESFTCLINLNQILALAMKVLYSATRVKYLMGIGEDGWQENVAVEFDSGLTAWFDSIPAHRDSLDPACANDIFFDQSAALHCGYYFMRILIHRPFIPVIRRSTLPTSVPSLSICNTAARACIHVAEVQHQRRPNSPLVFGQTAVFAAGVVLFLNVVGGKRTGRIWDTDLLDVHRCIRVLRGHKTRWSSTGPLLDSLEQLVKVAQASPANSPHEDYEPSPFVTEPVTEPIGSPLPARSFQSVHYNPIMSGHFVGSISEEPARPPQLHNTPLYNPSMMGEDPARPPHLPPATGNISSFHAPDVFHPPDPPYSAHGQDAPTDMDTLVMWSAAPTGFEMSDWD
ncbi:hypothetical protein FB451DRAFT_1149620 [Mycena latifolia]|nr:hypothetical protein FB451DRAFT_1149620 [Mycena latifolia]